jgi:ornithine cyclodeaminase
VLDARAVGRLLDPDTARASQREAVQRLAGAGAGDRHQRSLAGGEGAAPVVAVLGRGAPHEGVVCKLVGVPDPAAVPPGTASIGGIVVVLHPESGRPLAVLDGASVTALRTAAGTAVAVDALAGPDVRRLAVLGTGVAGLAHARALGGLRGWERVVLWNRTPSRSAEAAVELELPCPIEVAGTPEEAVRGADVVCACTTGVVPVVRGAALAPGTLVASIASARPGRCELDAAALDRAAIVVDHAVHAPPDRPVTELASVLGGTRVEAPPGGVIAYLSGGLPIQDALAAAAIIERAAREGGVPTIALDVP